MDNGYFLAQSSQFSLFIQEQSALIHPFYHFISVFLFKLMGVHGVAYFNNILLILVSILVFQLSRLLGLDKKGSIVAAVSVLLTHSIFWVSTKVEVYMLHLLLILLCYLIALKPDLTKKSLVFLGIVSGLALSTHQLTLVVLIPLYLFVLSTKKHHIWPVIPGFLVGIVFLYPVFFSSYPFWRTCWFLLTGSSSSYGDSVGYASSLFRFDQLLKEKKYVFVLCLSFLGLPFFGLKPYLKNKIYMLLWASATLNLIFAISYNVYDRFTFFLPGAAFYAILGTYLVYLKYPKWAMFLSGISPLLCCFIYFSSEYHLVPLPKHENMQLPFRHDVRYFLLPYLRDRSAEIFVKEYSKVVPGQAVVLADCTPMGAFLSAQQSGLFLNRHIVGSYEDIKSKKLNGPIYIVRLIGDVEKKCHVMPYKIGYIACDTL